MRTLAILALALPSLVATSHAVAQEASPLARALLARYPEHEIVPQSCSYDGERVTGTDRICVFDPATGLVRAVRRVTLGDTDLPLAARGTDVFFVAQDLGNVQTRFAFRAWRWDLARDAYLGLGNAGYDMDGDAMTTSFGVLYRLRSGWFLNDGSAGRRVTMPDPVPRATVVGDRTFGIDYPSRVLAMTLEGDRVRTSPHATLPGRILLADGAHVLALDAGRLHLLALPATTPRVIEWPAASGEPTSAARIDAGHWRIFAERPRSRSVLDLATGTLTPEAAAPATPSPGPLRASSIVHVFPTTSGIWVGRFGRGWMLDADGAASRRRQPRPASSRCSCTETTLECRRPALQIADACTEVPELDRITDSAEGIATLSGHESVYAPGARFRIDRLEADLVRITRLADGARIWVRLFDDAIFVQADDGTYFTSDRALTARMAIRDGRSILEAPIAPLAPRADALFRERLVHDFFAPPAPPATTSPPPTARQ